MTKEEFENMIIGAQVLSAVLDKDMEFLVLTLDNGRRISIKPTYSRKGATRAAIQTRKVLEIEVSG